MKYGDIPTQLKKIDIYCPEMMFYQYLPIKMPGDNKPKYENRLTVFDELVGIVCCDFIGEFGLDRYVDSYVYLTAKHMYQQQGKSFNREGWHSDGFMTDDINYIWSSDGATVFNCSDFNLTMDDRVSLKEMEHQADPKEDFCYPPKTIVRLNQFNIHRVGRTPEGMRTFVKLSFSKDKYNLIGNAHNYELDYVWSMQPRKQERNIPQSI